MQNNNQDISRKSLVKSLIKAALYIGAFLVLVFIFLFVGSYFWLENQKMDMSDMISFEKFEQVPAE